MNRVHGFVLIIFALFLAVSLLSYSNADPPDSLVFPAAAEGYQGYHNVCGKWGAYTASWLFNALGYSAYLIVLPIFALIYCWWHGKVIDQIFLRLVGLVLIFVAVSSLVCLNITEAPNGPIIGPGGYLGVTAVYFLNGYFSYTGITVIFVGMLAGGLVLTCDYSMIRIFLWVFGLRSFRDVDSDAGNQRVSVPEIKVDRSVRTLSAINNRNAEIDEPGEDEEVEQEYDEGDAGEIDESEDDEEYSDDEETDEDEETEYEEDEYEDVEEDDNAEEETVEPAREQPAKASKGLISWLKIKRPKEETANDAKTGSQPDDAAQDEEETVEEKIEAAYDLPSVELLIESEQHDYDQQMQTAKRQAKQLEKAFADFGLNIKVVDIQCGPVIAQFEVQLERGLRLNKITNLTDDIAIALRVPTIRIVAPIPGKNTVGVEVPNETRQLVRLREVIEETPDKQKSKMAIPIFLGQDVVGAPMVIDLAKMPHLLIAGRTGTGKSVCLNSIIVSLLMTRTPEECRMILIDPKMVELSPYKSIPHLMHPVVTDMKKAEAILAWAVDKMEQRYQILARAGVRQLSEYNALSEEELYRRVNPQSDEEWDETPRSMPYMVIVADEMADLMMTAAKEVETHIIRIAQKSRAVGIHLVLATQKPTVDIITGLIKSNLPARIAFEVATRMDSQVVLDRNGAEKLLGNGDMLFLKPGTSQVLRGQGTYVSDPEINEIIASVATDSPDYVIELVELQTGDEAQDDGLVDPRDELFNEAAEYIIREGRGSVSLLQRKFKIGYGRAARLVDFMEEDGIVGPNRGSQPREVTITLQQWRSRLADFENAFREQAVDKSPQGRQAGTQHAGGAKSNGAAEKPAAAKRPEQQFEIDDTTLDRLPLEGLRARQKAGHDADDDEFDEDEESVNVKTSPRPKDRSKDRSQDRRHGEHDSGRSSPPNIRPKVKPKHGPKRRPGVEPGVGPMEDVDDSMLAEIRPNGQRQKPGDRLKGPHNRGAGNKSGKALDAGYEIDYESDVYEDEKGGNVFGVVPVRDGDVPFDTDDEWEYEYEYVYEEIEADEDAEIAEDEAGEEEWYDDDIDVKARYVEEVNLEAGGDWESEEDWDDDGDSDEYETDEVEDEEEYDEYDYESDESGDEWDEDEAEER